MVNAEVFISLFIFSLGLPQNGKVRQDTATTKQRSWFVGYFLENLINILRMWETIPFRIALSGSTIDNMSVYVQLEPPNGKSQSFWMIAV